MSDIVVLNIERGPCILLRTRGDRVFVVINDKRGHYIPVTPAIAAQVASGIDMALERVTRDGRIVPPPKPEMPF